MKVRNKSGATREVDVDGATLTVEDGHTIDVPDELAKGEPPKGKPADLDYHPGTSGLLAQEDVWEAVRGNDKPVKGEED